MAVKAGTLQLGALAGDAVVIDVTADSPSSPPASGALSMLAIGATVVREPELGGEPREGLPGTHTPFMALRSNLHSSSMVSTEVVHPHPVL
mmetsp:Transcript_144395/g.402283  ORF Transcript_144395/g.402283 Transcript_144395/m.402283 type:complete len:91 (-) Transcript_144395:657-929(-)